MNTTCGWSHFTITWHIAFNSRHLQQNTAQWQNPFLWMFTHTKKLFYLNVVFESVVANATTKRLWLEQAFHCISFHTESSQVKSSCSIAREKNSKRRKVNSPLDEEISWIIVHLKGILFPFISETHSLAVCVCVSRCLCDCTVIWNSKTYSKKHTATQKPFHMCTQCRFLCGSHYRTSRICAKVSANTNRNCHKWRYLYIYCVLICGF